MTNREFTAQRAMLANAFAPAGAELLEYMGVPSALAAIPNTEPQQYVVAGTLQMIAKALPGVSQAAPAAPEQVQAKAWSARDALLYAARVVELYDDATMQGDYMIDSKDCAEILTALTSMPMFSAAPIAAAPAARPDLVAEACAVLDQMLEGCRDPKFGDFQNGHGETIGPRMDALHAKLRAAVAAPAAPEQWISTTERMPEDGQTVLISCPEPTPEVWESQWNAGSQTFESKANGWVRGDEVSHWMHKTAAPEQDEVRNQAPAEEWSYSTDEERYHDPEPSRLAILHHAVGELKSQGEDSGFWIGRNVRFTGKGDAGVIIDGLKEQAYDECGEFAETYLEDVTPAEEMELESLVTNWARSVDRSNFWTVRDTEFFTIEEARTEIERLESSMKTATNEGDQA